MAAERRPKVETSKDDIEDITNYLMGMTGPPEVTLKADREQKEAEKADQEKTDWTKVNC